MTLSVLVLYLKSKFGELGQHGLRWMRTEMSKTLGYVREIPNSDKLNSKIFEVEFLRTHICLRTEEVLRTDLSREERPRASGTRQIRLGSWRRHSQ